MQQSKMKLESTFANDKIKITNKTVNLIELMNFKSKVDLLILSKDADKIFGRLLLKGFPILFLKYKQFYDPATKINLDGLISKLDLPVGINSLPLSFNKVFLYKFIKYNIQYYFFG
jgi:galactitol-specific phosphotransferase system IIB component